MRSRAFFGLAGLALIGAGVAREVVVPAAPAESIQKLVDAPRFGKGHLAAVLAKRAPRLDPTTRDRLAAAVIEESARAGYDPLFVVALVAVESGFRVSVESQRGARGLVQLKPSTFAWLSAREPDLHASAAALGDDPIVDLRLAVRYVRWLEHRFESRDAALIAYNAGPRRAREELRSGQVPDRLLSYVRAIRKEHGRLARLAENIEPLPELPAPPVLVAQPVLLAGEVIGAAFE